MSEHIPPISHYPPHKRIETFLKFKKMILKRQSLKSNSARSRLGAKVVEEGAKVSQIIMCYDLCIKPNLCNVTSVKKIDILGPGSEQIFRKACSRTMSRLLSI